MYIAVLETYYEIYAVGKTKEEAMKNLLKGYKETYSKEDRTIKTPKSAAELFEHFGGGVLEVKNGYATS